MPTHSETPRVLSRAGPDADPVTTRGRSFGFHIGHLGGPGRSRLFFGGGGIRVFGAVALAAILAVAGACGGKDSTAPVADPECVIPSVTNFVDSAVARVVISNFGFQPASITIKAGQTVKWKHCGPEVDQHTVTSASGTLLDAPYLSKGAIYTRQFDVAATNSYHCIPHPEMTGTVIVQP